MVADKLLQALTVPVNIYSYSRLFVTGTISALNFYSYSRLFVTGADIYSRLFVTDSVVHLPHCVQCITIPIIKGGLSEIKWGGGVNENRFSVFSHPGGCLKSKICFHSPRGVSENRGGE